MNRIDQPNQSKRCLDGLDPLDPSPSPMSHVVGKEKSEYEVAENKGGNELGITGWVGRVLHVEAQLEPKP